MKINRDILRTPEKANIPAKTIVNPCYITNMLATYYQK